MVIQDVPLSRSSVVTKAIRWFVTQGLRPSIDERYGFVRLFGTKASRVAVFVDGKPVSMTQAAFADKGALYPPGVGPVVSVNLRFDTDLPPARVTIRLWDAKGGSRDLLVPRLDDGRYYVHRLPASPVRWPQTPPPMARWGTKRAPWHGDFVDDLAASVRFYAHDATRQYGIAFGDAVPPLRSPLRQEVRGEKGKRPLQ